MKVTLAIYATPGEPLDEYVSVYRRDSEPFLANRVRRSEYVEVDFPLRNREETIDQELKTLDEMEQHIHQEAHKKILTIVEQRKKLLALSYARPEVLE